MMFVGSLSLMGFPFLTGFYSKDAILELAYGSFSVSGHFAHWLGTISAFMTAFYSMRLIYLTFINKTNAYKQSIQNAHDLPKIMGYPLIILVFGSIFIGYLTKDMIIGVGTNFWGNSLFILPHNMLVFEAEFLPHSIKMIPVIFSVSGMVLAHILYSMTPLKILYNFKMTSFGLAFYNFFNRKWFFDKVYNEYLNQGVLYIGYDGTYKVVDRGIIEFFGPFGLSNVLYNSKLNVSRLQTGLIYHYTFVMLVGAVLITTLIGLNDVFSFFVDVHLFLLFVTLVFFMTYFSKKLNG